MQLPLEDVMIAHTRISENGRIVIPAAMREKLGLKGGDVVLLTFEKDRMIVQSQQAAIRKTQQELRALVGPDRCLSDELIAERREEARREMAEFERDLDRTRETAAEMTEIG